MLFRGLIALAFGTLGLGITEFVAMGLLPYWASDFNVSIAQSGYGISAYALGVAVGAFIIIALRAMKLKHILLILIVIFILGNCLTAFAPTYETLLGARFISGFPHGAYFGVGSIIAQRLAAKGKGSSAVSIMIAGMTVANIFGVPLGTALANSISWRAIFYIVIVWGLLVFLAAALWIRDVGKIQDSGFKSQFNFLKCPAPWLVLSATMFGNAGIFCMLSYLSPLLTDHAGVPLEWIAGVMVVIGIGMVIANLVSGRMCDKYTPAKVGIVSLILAAVFLLAIAAFGTNAIAAIILVVATASMLFAVGAPVQVSILRTALGGLLLGASMIQAAFNLGNALGASVGGVPFENEWNLSLVPLFGAVMTAIGGVSIYLYFKKYEHMFKDLTEDNEDNVNQQDGLSLSMANAVPSREFGMTNEMMAAYHRRRAAEYEALVAQEKAQAQELAAKLKALEESAANREAQVKAEVAAAEAAEAAAKEAPETAAKNVPEGLDVDMVTKTISSGETGAETSGASGSASK